MEMGESWTEMNCTLMVNNDVMGKVNRMCESREKEGKEKLFSWKNPFNWESEENVPISIDDMIVQCSVHVSTLWSK